MIYFNNAADAYPRIADVAEFFNNQEYFVTGRECSCQTDKAQNVTEVFREKIKQVLNLPEGYQVTITHGATEAANLIINSFHRCHKQHGYVVYDHGCHNSIIRPIKELYGDKDYMMHTNYIMDPCLFDYNKMESLCFNPQLCEAIFFSYQSNVTGSVLVGQKDIFRFIDAHHMKCPVVFDITQAIGNTEIDVTELLKGSNFKDLYLFGTTHKSLRSIPGVGFVVHPVNNCLTPLIYGGTGTGRDRQPHDFPHYLESGTYDIPSLACAIKAIDHYMGFGDTERLAKEQLVKYFIDEFTKLEEQTSIGDYLKVQKKFVNPSSGIINLIPVDDTVGEYVAISLFAKKIIVRFGCHCCSEYVYQDGDKGVHQTLRVSFSPFNTKSEIDTFMKEIPDIFFDYRMSELC